MPFLLIFEGWGIVIEFLGVLALILSFALGIISPVSFAAFMLLSIGFGLVLSFTALLMEEITFHTYPKMKHVLVLFVVAIIENLGYRQLTAFWRFEGLIRHLRNEKSVWGEMTRKSSWQTTTENETAAMQKAPSIPISNTNGTK